MITRPRIRITFTRLLLFLAMITALLSKSNAIGIVVSRIPDLPPPRIKSIVIDSRVTNAVEKTRYTQVLYNDSSRPAEADFFFPVPAGATISDFILYMDGKPVTGEVLQSDEARKIYRDIVRKVKDPGLIEWSENGLYRVHIFPVPAHGEQKLEIETTRQLPTDQGYFQLRIPLQHKDPSGKLENLPAVSGTIEISDDQPIRNIYSPTHTIKPDTANPLHVKIPLNDLTGSSSDFTLYYQTTDDAVAASLLTQKSAETDGFFSLRLSPPWQANAAPSPEANYIFVMDTSGSMLDDDKITQARKALKYCVNALVPGNQFNIIPFATAVDTMKPNLVSATSAQKTEAIQWIENLNARGGTNISGALQAASEMINKDKSTTSAVNRIYTIVFITDGLPTIGINDPDQIIKSLDTISSSSVRIFTFGVGNDVNTRLLDRLAENTRATSDYISPGKDLEVPVSRFFDKVSRPALYNTRLAFEGIETLEIYPQQLPDMFYGSDLMVLGKYRNAGAANIKLIGTINGEQKTYNFSKAFPNQSNGNSFLEKLWATRKIAWMLDQVRTNGESNELRKEVEELARKYGVVTPYTSYLAMEDTRAEPATASGSASRNYSIQPREITGDIQLRAAKSVFASRAANDSFDLKAESGAAAIRTAQKISTMKQADAPALISPADNSIIVGNKRFTLSGNTWVDSALTGQNSLSAIQVRYLSDAWFDLSEANPEIKSYLALGKNVKFMLPNHKIIEIDESNGIDTINVTQIRALLAK